MQRMYSAHRHTPAWDDDCNCNCSDATVVTTSVLLPTGLQKPDVPQACTGRPVAKVRLGQVWFHARGDPSRR